MTRLLATVLLLATFISGPAAARDWYAGLWDFTDPGAYQFDADVIEVTGGVARLKPLNDDAGLALLLDGATQYATLADAAQTELDLAQDSFAIAAWIRIETGNTFHGIFEKRGDSNTVSGMQFHAESQGDGYRLRATFRDESGNAREALTPTAFQAGDWHQAVLAVDRPTGRALFYVDGKRFGNAVDISRVSGSLANDGPVLLGRNSLGSLGGALDEVAFWRFPAGLPADVDTLAREHFYGNTTQSGELISRWQFDARLGTDSIGANDVSFVGNPAFGASLLPRFADTAPALTTSCVSAGGDALYSAITVETGNHAGELRYQISTDGTTWRWFDGDNGWTIDPDGLAERTSLIRDITANLRLYPDPAATLCARIFMLSNGRRAVELDRLDIVSPPAELTLVNEPAANRPQPRGFRVIQETDLPATTYVEYRQAGNDNAAWLATSPVETGTLARIEVGGLSPGAVIDYRTRYRPWGSDQDFATSPTAQLRMPPQHQDADDVVFAVWGDSRPQLGIREQPAMFGELIETMTKDRAMMHISVGDSVNLTGLASLRQAGSYDLYDGWRDVYDLAGGNGFMLFGLGNHDGEGLPEPQRAFAANSRLRVTDPPDTPAEQSRYFSWRWGDALFVMMDGSSPNIDAAQEDWVAAELQQPAKWKFVFNHYPFFNSNRGVSSTAAQRLHDVFVAAGVQIVFQAHDHWYSDFVKDGIHYTTSGGAGSPLRAFEQAYQPVVDFHYLRVRLEPASVTVSAVKLDGARTGDTLLGNYCVTTPDVAPTDSDNDGTPDACDLDDDNDAVDDIADNCPATDNNDQDDLDGDSLGDACDDDDDGDALPDNYEVQQNLDPRDATDASADNDDDGLSNLAEFQIGTDPSDADSDDDGFGDGEERSAGTDPLDPVSAPAMADPPAAEPDTPAASGGGGGGSGPLTIAVLITFGGMLGRRRRASYRRH